MSIPLYGGLLRSGGTRRRVIEPPHVGQITAGAGFNAPGSASVELRSTSTGGATCYLRLVSGSGCSKRK